MSRIPARRGTRKRNKVVHRYLVGSIEDPQFYVEEYVSARMFLVYVPDDYSAKLPGIERFTLGRRLFEDFTTYKSLRIDRLSATISTLSPRVIHVPSLSIEIRGGRVIRLC
jgi:hypothetical protein